MEEITIIRKWIHPLRVSVVVEKSRLGLWLVSMFLTLQLSAQDQLQSIPDSDPEYEKSTLYPAEGLEVNLFASEPMIEKPIQMNWDEQGRLWVVGSNQYPQPKPGALPSGKVYILEDTDHDGRADTSIVFAEGLRVPTAVLPGDGGVYVANSTEVLHLKDTDGDGKADERHVILSGFGTGDTHHLIHTFRWGPDGSLFFNQSIYIYSHVETPYGVRRLEGGGVWRYRNETKELEIFARGLINPWGLQFNKYGQSFLTDGAGGEGINYAFQGATFATAPGAERIISGLNPGQPKHSGLDIITGSHMPGPWKGSLITNDFRANRINRFSLEKLESGYVSKQEEDILYSDNVAFRPVDILEGPDGAIYVADWYNPIIQHGEVDFRDPRRDRENGRIWRITKEDSPLVEVPDMGSASSRELLDYLQKPEAWTRNQARRILRERGAEEVIEDLENWIAGLKSSDENYHQYLLEAFWVYSSLDKKNEKVLEELLNASEPLIRAAAVRGLYFQYEKYPKGMDYLQKAVNDSDPVVRLEAVIALRKSSDAAGSALATEVLKYDMDPYLDFALWQTLRELEPIWFERYQKEKEYFGDDHKTAYALKSISNVEAISDLVKMYSENRVPEDYTPDVHAAIIKYGSPEDLSVIFHKMFSDEGKIDEYLDVLIAAAEQRDVKPDVEYSEIKTLFQQGDFLIEDKAITLASLWKLSQFRPVFIEWAESDNVDKIQSGVTAIARLADEESENLLIEFTKSGQKLDLQMAAIHQLIPMDAQQAAKSAVSLLADLEDEGKIKEILSSFYWNENGLKKLVEALSVGEVPDLVSKVGLEAIGSMSNRRKENPDIMALTGLLKKGDFTLAKPTMPQELNEREADRLELDVKAYGDASRGELVYRELGCASCHSIGGAGGKLGTDLSSLGANAPTDYIISSVLKPGNEIKDGYELNQVIKKNGNVVMGYKVRETEAELVLRDVAGNEVSVPKYQINTHQNVPGSLMPPGLTSRLSREEFVDLIGFLSKIGEPGDFRVPTNNYIRYWEALTLDEAEEKEINSNGWSVVAQQPGEYNWTPIYSKVSGGLPLEEVKRYDTEAGQKVLRFRMEVLSAGNVEVYFSGATVREVWMAGQKLDMASAGVRTELEEGIYEVIVILEGPEANEFKVEIPEGEGSKGRAKPIQGAR
ncbi:PVC-type heme-binding CxxCH protein [Membranihabitans maritimus]|uniref:PVC-type heme-binding CxxCH protein n=1 Tax=Membranihabitans maritimus TaxID=2904244 RepID=UPI001F34B989|nr:PVC-type heme-binding CxxCH protein [Membranihabitans maritimus]